MAPAVTAAEWVAANHGGPAALARVISRVSPPLASRSFKTLQSKEASRWHPRGWHTQTLTALSFAILEMDTAVVTMLLQSPAVDVNALDKEGYTSLARAVTAASCNPKGQVYVGMLMAHPMLDRSSLFEKGADHAPTLASAQLLPDVGPERANIEATRAAARAYQAASHGSWSDSWSKGAGAYGFLWPSGPPREAGEAPPPPEAEPAAAGGGAVPPPEEEGASPPPPPPVQPELPEAGAADAGVNDAGSGADADAADADKESASSVDEDEPSAADLEERAFYFGSRASTLYRVDRTLATPTTTGQDDRRRSALGASALKTYASSGAASLGAAAQKGPPAMQGRAEIGTMPGFGLRQW